VFAEDEAALILADGRDIETLLARRERGERLEHVLGWARFAGLTIDVDPGVFVPRPQTAELAERAAALRPSVALDLFAGTGAIAAVVSDRNPDARVVAAERDPSECLASNAQRYGFDAIRSDVDDGVPGELAGTVDVLTANVPYVPTAALPYVPHDGEPTTALDGGEDGLDWMRRVLACAPRWLRSGGTLLTECALDQRPAVRELLSHAGFGYASTPDVESSGSQNGVWVAAELL
jgi:release factor glutamine methyltransferase